MSLIVDAVVVAGVAVGGVLYAKKKGLLGSKAVVSIDTAEADVRADVKSVETAVTTEASKVETVVKTDVTKL